ncbi:MAG: hypothetical protein VYA05_06335 [Pseudomonadota bacterium]|nr:hypothetical protein [Pseudomonadota bacterium]MEC9300436.1 hypothetical protein [Pseudomonadota bacterium]
MRKNLIIRTIFVLLAILAGYGSLAAEVESVFISSRLDPNAIIITEVDIIFIYEQEILEGFPATKTLWYSGKRQFIQSVGDKADVVNIFIPQGFDSVMASLPARRAQALKVYVFGQHDASSAAPVDITEIQNVLVEIDQFGIVVSRRR